MSAAAQVNTPEAPPLERKLAMAMHLVSIVTPLWLPFIIWAVAKASKTPFLQAHSRQAAFEGIVWKAIMVIIFLVSISFTIVRLFHHFSTGWQDFSWQEVGIRLIISLTVFIILWLINLVQSIFQATAAAKGIWPKRERKRFAKELANPSRPIA